MNCFFLFRTALVLALFCSPILSHAAWILKDGRLIEVEEVATLSPEAHYQKGIDAWNHQDWDNAAYQFRIVITNFPGFVSRMPPIFFFTGAAYFYMGEYDYADEQFNAYLHSSCSPEYLEETMEYKFAIAEEFRCGAKRRFFGSRRLPKWSCGKDHAIKIYDEIVSTLPCHDLAAQALFYKGMLLCDMKDFSCSVEAYQALIRRFPMHELAPESYLAIMRVYLHQAYCEYQNSDILALAEIVLRHFIEDFPNEERLQEAECDLAEIQEVYAYGLYETGAFYERTCHPQASILYYSSAIRQFPQTCVADSARHRLCCLVKKYPCLMVPEEKTDNDECL